VILAVSLTTIGGSIKLQRLPIYRGGPKGVCFARFQVNYSEVRNGKLPNPFPGAFLSEPLDLSGTLRLFYSAQVGCSSKYK